MFILSLSKVHKLRSSLYIGTILRQKMKTSVCPQLLLLDPWQKFYISVEDINFCCHNFIDAMLTFVSQISQKSGKLA